MTKQTEFANSLVGSSAGIKHFPVVRPYRSGNPGHWRCLSGLRAAAPGGSDPRVPSQQPKRSRQPSRKRRCSATTPCTPAVELGGVHYPERRQQRDVGDDGERRHGNARSEPVARTAHDESIEDAILRHALDGQLRLWRRTERRLVPEYVEGQAATISPAASGAIATTSTTTCWTTRCCRRASAATPALVAEPSSLHLFNTVRRNTDALFTLFPFSRVSFRVGYNHNTHEGPTYSTMHGGGDVQVSAVVPECAGYLHRRRRRQAGEAHHAEL